MPAIANTLGAVVLKPTEQPSEPWGLQSLKLGLAPFAVWVLMFIPLPQGLVLFAPVTDNPTMFQAVLV